MKVASYSTIVFVHTQGMENQLLVRLQIGELKLNLSHIMTEV